MILDNFTTPNVKLQFTVVLRANKGRYCLAVNLYMLAQNLNNRRGSEYVV